jgi:hypothetical protein
MHPRRQQHPSLLSGLAFCIYCGAAMVLHTSPDYRSYTCGDRDRKNGYKDCTKSHRVSTLKADRVVLDTVLNRILSPVFVDALLEDIQRQMVDTSRIDHEIGHVNNLLILTDRSIKRMIELAKVGGDIQEIAEDLKKLKQEQAEYNARIKALKVERLVETPQLTPKVILLVFDAWRAEIKKAHQSDDILLAKKLINCFVSKIELGANIVVIHYTFPLTIPAENTVPISAHKVP